MEGGRGQPLHRNEAGRDAAERPCCVAGSVHTPQLSHANTTLTQASTTTPSHPTHTERERVSVSNVASTMVALLVNNPALAAVDLSSMRLLSCGGSPQSPAVVAAAIAAFGCEFFVSYGMTECCGKISMSLLPPGAVEAAAAAAAGGAGGEQQEGGVMDAAALLDLINTSGRPFELMEASPLRLLRFFLVPHVAVNWDVHLPVPVSISAYVWPVFNSGSSLPTACLPAA